MGKHRNAKLERRLERQRADAEQAQYDGIWEELDAAGVKASIRNVAAVVSSPLFHRAYNLRLQVVEAVHGPITHQDAARDVAVYVLNGWGGVSSEDLDAITLKIAEWNPMTKALTFRVDPSHKAALAAVERYKAKAAKDAA